MPAPRTTTGCAAPRGCCCGVGSGGSAAAAMSLRISRRVIIGTAVDLSGRYRLFGPLKHAQRLLVHLVDDLGVRASGRLETGPRHGVGRFTIGVEVVEELARRDAGREAI